MWDENGQFKRIIPYDGHRIMDIVSRVKIEFIGANVILIPINKVPRRNS